AVGFIYQVIGTVEALAFVLIDEHRQLAVLLDPLDDAVAVAAADQPAFGIEHQPVGAGLWCVGNERLRAGVADALAEDADPALGIPLHDLVGRDVGENEKALVLDPAAAFGPIEALGDHLDLRICR